MNEREIRALLKETTRAAKAYKADLQVRTELQARINAGVKPNTPAVKGKSVKVVPPTSSLARDIKNIKETGKVLGAKEGTTARAAAALRVRTSGGLGGGGTLRNVIR